MHMQVAGGEPNRFLLKEILHERGGESLLERGGDRRFFVIHKMVLASALSIGPKKYIMSQQADGGTLHDYWRSVGKPNLSAKLVAGVICQLAGLFDALYQLHSRNFRHGSLCPGRILRHLDETQLG